MKVGIIGTGWIAAKAALTLKGMDSCEAYAVGSRRKESAEAFAAQWGIQKSYGSYSELIADPNVDLIYVGTPHSHHFEHASLAINAGKPNDNTCVGSASVGSLSHGASSLYISSHSSIASSISFDTAGTTCKTCCTDFGFIMFCIISFILCHICENILYIALLMCVIFSSTLFLFIF